MDFQELVAAAYETFSCFEKPEHSTNYRHCEECAEYDETLERVTRQELSIEQIGTVCWGPIAFLTPEAMAYYMPRLIELAASGVDNKDRDPYFTQFINQVSNGPESHQYALFGKTQRSIVAATLSFIKDHFYDEVCENCWETDLETAIEKWSV